MGIFVCKLQHFSLFCCQLENSKKLLLFSNHGLVQFYRYYFCLWISNDDNSIIDVTNQETIANNMPSLLHFHQYELLRDLCTAIDFKPLDRQSYLSGFTISCHYIHMHLIAFCPLKICKLFLTSRLAHILRNGMDAAFKRKSLL